MLPHAASFSVVGGGSATDSPASADGEVEDDDRPKLSDRLNGVASNVMLARNVLKLATTTGMPDPITVWMTARGIDRVTGKRFLPAWLQSGPVPDAINNLILGSALVDSIDAVTPSSPLSPASPAPASNVSKTAPVGPPPGGMLTALRGNATKLLKPLFYAGFTMSSVAGILALGERIREHGTEGLISTTDGRGALLGAISGALILGSMYLPAGPAQLYADLASNVSWLFEEINGHGWLDGLLGANAETDDQEKRTPPR